MGYNAHLTDCRETDPVIPRVQGNTEYLPPQSLKNVMFRNALYLVSVL